MRCIRIGTFPSFDREFKRLAKKYKSLTQDLQILVNELRDNPYLGTDGIKPFIDDCKKYGKGIFILVKTSNKSSGELQDLKLENRKNNI